MKRIERQVFLCLLRLAWGSAKRSGLEDRRCAQRHRTRQQRGLGSCAVFTKTPVCDVQPKNFSDQCRGIWVCPLLLSLMHKRPNCRHQTSF
jgi:hypothetical protein